MDHTDSWSNKVTTNRTRHWAIALQYLIPLVAAVPTLYFKPGLASLTPLLTGVSVFTALLFGLLGIIFNAGVTLRKDGDSCGCSTLTAATILGEIADVRRFRSRHAFARHNGTAPLPVWSSNHARHRLSRTGNRQLNTAIHRIAITQARHHEPARQLLQRRRNGGKNKAESIRILKRRLSDVVYQALRADARPSAPSRLKAA